MIEDEAKTKWCPHAVASHTDPRSTSDYERPELGLPAKTFIHACIGSACMAWRWSEAKDTEAFLAVVRDHMKATGDNFAKATQSALVEHRDALENTEGYCGLSGRPQ